MSKEIIFYEEFHSLVQQAAYLQEGKHNMDYFGQGEKGVEENLTWTYGSCPDMHRFLTFNINFCINIK